MGAGCIVCRELRGDIAVPGGFLLEDAAAAAFHYPPLEEVGNTRPYLGHLLVVTRLLPRYSGTPRDVPWHSVDEWEDARHGGAHEIAELVALLETSLDDD
jgi:hypothetical protein